MGLSIDHVLSQHEPDKTYYVWQHNEIKTNYRKPGVYIFQDIEGEIICVGDSGNGNKDMIGDRVYNHIHGSTVQS